MAAFATTLIDRWLARAPADATAVAAARDAVSGLEPAVVVCGGSRGIGAAVASRFAKAGRRVVLVARSTPELDATASSIALTTGQQPLCLTIDISTADAFATLSRALAANGLYCDVLVLSAAMGLSGPFTGLVADDLDRLVALNVTAPTRLARAALPAMLARRQGGLITLASTGAYTPGPHQAAYYASKAYVLSLTEALAIEIAGHGVRVCAVVPGPVDTGFHAAMGAHDALYRVLIPSLSAERVANSAYRGFMLGRRVVVPGLVNRAMALALRLAPHTLTGPIVSVLLRRREK